MLSISVVSASDDTNQTDDININSFNSEVSFYDNGNSNSINDSQLISESADSGTFSDLQKIINLAADGNTIHLSKNYVSDNTNLRISKSLTIEGDGFTLDGLGKSKILQINTENYVVLNNIIFKNAFDNAIQFNRINSNSVISNCIFDNGIGSSYGSYGIAILFTNTVSNLIIDSTRFLNNKNAVGGGALYFTKESNNNIIRNCEFMANVARTGGAISFENNVNNNYFLNNTFFSNSAITKNNDYGGGAIYFEKDLTHSVFENNEFIMNNATVKDGGAIFVRGNNVNNLIKNCVFSNNHAEQHGGVIFLNSKTNDFNITNSIFEKNSASYGGGLFFGDVTTNVNIYSSEFYGNNNAIGGGAIYFKKESLNNNFTNVDFNSNSANAGGAIAFENNMVNNIFELVNFTNNTGKTIKNNYGGGAIFVEGNAHDNNFRNSLFANNTVTTNGGAINIRGNLSDNSFEFVNFSNNTAAINGGALSINGNSQNNNFTAFFVNNKAKNDGGAVYVGGKSNNDLFNDGAFNNNQANCGGAILFNGNVGNILIDEYNFTNNNNAVGGGAIYFRKESNNNNIENCEFINNVARSGGAIFFENNVDNNYFTNNNFTENSAVTNNSDYGGGAIFCEKTMKNTLFENNNFIYNTATTDGGAIYLKNTEHTLFLNDNFTENTAGRGSAIFIIAGKSSDVLSSKFINNNDAICFNGGYSGSVVGSTFEGESQIFVGENAKIYLFNNIELGNYDNSNPFIVNNGVLSLENNTLANVIFNHGNIISDTTMIVLDNKTITVKEPLVRLNASCIDDNNNFIVSDNVLFKVNDSYISLPFYDKYAYGYYYLENQGHYLINASLDNVLSKCDYKIGIIDYESKSSSFLNVDNVTIKVNEYAKVIANLPADATGLIIADIENESYVALVNNGYARFIISDLTVGIHEMHLTYLGDDNYDSASAVSYINVISKSTSFLNVDNVTIKVNEYAKVIANLPADATGLIIADIENESYVALVNNGYARFIISDLTVGIHEMHLTYLGDDNYDSASAVSYINVTSSRSIEMPDVVKYYKGDERLVVKITDGGEPIVGKFVEFNINGVNYNRTTNNDGIASIALNLNSGNYTASVKIDNETYSARIIILSTVTVHNLTKIFRNDTQYYAYFVDSRGNPLSYTMVSFNIHGVFYDRRTDENGVAKLNINLEPGEYICTAINPSTGEMKTSIVKVISQFIEHEISNIEYTVRILSKDGTPVGEGEKVSFNIAGVIYERITNSTGYVVLNVKLMKGEHIITAKYLDEQISDKITI